ncbi:hypothetical protein L7F22_051420 [Adiantum nelumboides]|nr:hypothetical protein [Adiantum nelumboides]
MASSASMERPAHLKAEDGMLVGRDEAEYMVEKLRTFDIEQVGSTQWLAQHEAIEKLNLQAHYNTMSHSNDFVMEALISLDKFGILVHELLVIEVSIHIFKLKTQIHMHVFLRSKMKDLNFVKGNYMAIMIGHTLAKLYGAVLEVELSTHAEASGIRAPGKIWMEKIFPEIIKAIVPEISTVALSLTILHEGSIANLLEVVLYHQDACEAVGPDALLEAESTNKVLIALLRKACHQHPTSWAKATLGTLWAYRTSFKATTDRSPFQLAFGMEAIAPFEFNSGSPRVGSVRMEGGIQSAHFSRLSMLEETRLLAANALNSEQLRRKAWHDRHLRRPQFGKGSLVLLYHARKQKKTNKLVPVWQGPFMVQEILPQGAVQVTTLEGTTMPLVNGSRLKLYRAT